MFAQLGNIVFEIKKSPVSMSITGEAVYAEHELIDRKSKLQRTGSTLDKIDLGLLFDAAFCNPSAEIKRLKDYRASGEVLYFIWGTGEVVGRFVITTIDEGITNTLPDGTILRIEAMVNLLEYEIDDEKIPERQLGIDQAKAIDTSGLLKYDVAKIGQVDAKAQLAKEYNSIVSGGAGVNSIITENGGVLNAGQKVDVRATANTIRQAALDFKEKAINISEVLNRNADNVANHVNGYIRDLVSNENGVSVAVANVVSACDSLKGVMNSSPGAIIGNNNAFQAVVTNFKNIYSGVRKYEILRQ